MDTAVKRLGIKVNHVRVEIMGRDTIHPKVPLDPIGDSVGKRIAKEFNLFRSECKKVGWLRDLMT
jgi:hypothetical protein